MTVPAEVVLQIQKAREEGGLTLSQLESRFPGVSRSTIYKHIKGCDASKVQRASPTRRVVTNPSPVERPPLSKSNIGEAARQIISARLMLNGLDVYRPLSEDTPIDLLVLVDGSALKCQCKYIYPTPNGSHTMLFRSVRKNGPNRQAVSHRYTHLEVDFFLGYCLDNDSVYVFPYEAAGGRLSTPLWILRKPCGTNGKSLNTEPYLNAFHLIHPRIPSVS